MEADSTTLDCSSSKPFIRDGYPHLPFTVLVGNLKFYNEIVYEKTMESQRSLIDWLQEFGLIPATMQCPTGHPDSNMSCKPARVVDRVIWVCDKCSMHLPIRFGTFFMKLSCSIFQILQLVLAWCEDADINVAAQYFDVKPRVAMKVYEKLDAMAINEATKHKLGGENHVVLSEMYPDCVNRLSPDTTDQPHAHRILMLADTNHIPTRYWLHVIKSDSKKGNVNSNKLLHNEVMSVLGEVCAPLSLVVRGQHVPEGESGAGGGVSLRTLTQRCDNGMQHFLCDRIWRKAIALCSGSRDLCADAGRSPAASCSPTVQRYLHAASYRLRYGDGFYRHVLTRIANDLYY